MVRPLFFAIGSEEGRRLRPKAAPSSRRVTFHIKVSRDLKIPFNSSSNTWRARFEC